MLAIELLGESGGRSIMSAFRELRATERDSHAVVEFALATARIGGAGSRAILSGPKSTDQFW